MVSRIALRQLLKQTYDPGRLEVIVVDNGSEQATVTRIRKMQPQFNGRMRLIYEHSIRSSYAARNRGIEAASGTILAFTDADCVPDPGWVESGVKAIVESCADAVAGQVEMFVSGTYPNIWQEYDMAKKFNQRANVEQSGYGGTGNLFVRRVVFGELGMFLETLQSGGDYEFGRRLVGAGKRLEYAHEAVVRHPARSSFMALLKKRIRKARGHRHLDGMGLLKGPRHSLRKWRLVGPPPRISGVPRSLAQTAILTILANLFRYINLIIRT
ncbi:MAG: glycosyltransferase [Gammaproteobacteria bacterium]|nr:glycosyltransferase [Gammaproteobacteria bacterium]